VTNLTGALIIYGSAIASIYAIATKLQDILNPEFTRELYRAYRTYSFTRAVQNANVATRQLVDRLLGFHYWKAGLYIPRFRKVMLVSTLLFACYAIPVVMLFTQGGILPTTSQEIVVTIPAVTILVISSWFIDYVSYIKSRSIMSRIDGSRALLPISLWIAADVVLSFFIVSAMMFPAFFFLMLVTIPLNELAGAFGFGLAGMPLAIAEVDLWMMLLVTSLIISLFISICGAIVATMQYTMQLIYRFDRLKQLSTKVLNFEEKPALAAGVVLISLFTIVYWGLVFSGYA
jgi:hypothetical protein